MQSSFTARVSQLISVVRASACIDFDATATLIKRLASSIFERLEING